MAKVVERPGVTYTHDDNDIHTFVFTNDSEHGLDEFFVLLRDLLRHTSSAHTLRYLVDVSQSDGRAPIGELVQRFRQLEAQIPDRAAGRAAILHNASLMLTLANTIIDTFAPTQDKTRFFEARKRDEAYDWLLSDD